ncbi:MAG: S-layer homology domain-containing protein [Clostridiales bacterium]|nr:S-layer homology domain-containing protein [Clostridiales bacterium]
MKKRIFALLAVFALLPGSAGSASAGFTDISDSETAMAAAALESMGIVAGTGTDIYSPSGALTRAELAPLAVRAMGLEDRAGSHAAKTLFSDVTPGKWYTGYVNLAYSEGIINGYGNGKFGPDDNVTCGQAATVLLRMLGYTESEIGMSWPNDYVSFANDLGLAGSLSLSANCAVSRGQAAILFYNAVKEPVSGSSRPYYETVGGVASVESAIVLGNNATWDSDSGYLTACLTGEAEAAIKYYRQKTTVPDTLVVSIGKLLMNSAGQVIGFLPDGLDLQARLAAAADYAVISKKSFKNLQKTVANIRS